VTVTEIHTHLQELRFERVLAAIEGLDTNECYMADLEDEIAAVNEAYVGAVVTEIALLRADMSAPLTG
jgi:hypothetical protein